MNRRSFTAWVGRILMVGSMGVAPCEGATDTTLLLGMSSPMSGTAGAYGQQIRDGIEACFERVNATGGVAGKRLQLAVMDDGYEVDRAVENTKRLIFDDKVFALMGFYGTASTTAVLPLIEQAGIPLVGTVTGADALRSPANQHIFHVRASYKDETAKIVRNLHTVGVTRIAVLYQDDGFGQSGLDGVRQALAGVQLKPVAVAPVARNSTDVAAAVSTIAAASPQAVVLVSLYRPAAAFIRQLRLTSARPHFAALSPIGTDKLVDELGPAEARGVQVAQVIPYPWTDQHSVVRDYRRDLAAYSAKTAKSAAPSYYGLEGYINARLIVAAIERTGRNLTRERLMAALKSGPYDLGGFRLSFERPGNAGSGYVDISIIGAEGRVLH